MYPQSPNSLDKPPQETPPAVVEQPTQSVEPVATSPKKSHKRAIVIAVIGLLLIIGAIVAYLLYGQSNSDSSTGGTLQGTTESSTTLTPLDETTNIYTDGVTDETSLTDSQDNSDDAGDASNSAGNVGDGVNENNL